MAVIFIPVKGLFARQAPRLSNCLIQLLGIKFNFNKHENPVWSKNIEEIEMDMDVEMEIGSTTSLCAGPELWALKIISSRGVGDPGYSVYFLTYSVGHILLSRDIQY